MSGEARAILNAADVRGKKNATGATIIRGTVIKLSPATDDLMLRPTAVADAHYGVLMGDVLDGQWGDVQVAGMAVCIAGTGGVTRGDRVTHDAGGFGRVATAAPAGAANNDIIGVANRTAAVGTYVEVELARPGTTLQG